MGERDPVPSVGAVVPDASEVEALRGDILLTDLLLNMIQFAPSGEVIDSSDLGDGVLQQERGRGGGGMERAETFSKSATLLLLETE